MSAGRDVLDWGDVRRLVLLVVCVLFILNEVGQGATSLESGPERLRTAVPSTTTTTTAPVYSAEWIADQPPETLDVLLAVCWPVQGDEPAFGCPFDPTDPEKVADWADLLEDR